MDVELIRGSEKRWRVGITDLADGLARTAFIQAFDLCYFDSVAADL